MYLKNTDVNIQGEFNTEQYWNNTKTNNTESNFVYKNVTKLCNITSDQGLISM